MIERDGTLIKEVKHQLTVFLCINNVIAISIYKTKIHDTQS